ncbi:hypothetical protein JQR88_10960 [Pseudomonas luteola]|uniref:hypothetical protein n=1 Tax=Pseudomonas luteola TaxID=47886 RepID=UPI003DA1877C
MNIFEQIEQAKEQVKAEGKSVTLNVTEEEMQQFLGTTTVVEPIVNSGAVPLKQQRDEGTGPLRVYLENGSTLLSISI